jgi:hypothetical protein
MQMFKPNDDLFGIGFWYQDKPVCSLKSSPAEWAMWAQLVDAFCSDCTFSHLAN